MGFDVLSIVQMIGGLALFIYGMTTMGKGLERAAGSKLEKTLEKMTGNVVTALLMGMVVTMVIQSSSATTVMVVGFVNAGIMTLKQSVGVILGANIGTTVTAQILRLSGGEGSFFSTGGQRQPVHGSAQAEESGVYHRAGRRNHHDACQKAPYPRYRGYLHRFRYSVHRHVGHGGRGCTAG